MHLPYYRLVCTAAAPERAACRSGSPRGKGGPLPSPLLVLPAAKAIIEHFLDESAAEFSARSVCKIRMLTQLLRPRTTDGDGMGGGEAVAKRQGGWVVEVEEAWRCGVVLWGRGNIAWRNSTRQGMEGHVTYRPLKAKKKIHKCPEEVDGTKIQHMNGKKDAVVAWEGQR